MKRFFLKIALLILFTFVLGEIICRIYYDFTMASNTGQLSSIKDVIYELRPNSEEKRHGVRLKVNSLGFRDYEYLPQKPKNKIRVFILGDSVSMGRLEPVENIFPKRLEDILGGRYEVWNLGVSGYDTQKEAAVLKNKWIKYNPDIVILAICLNDYESLTGFLWINWMGRLEQREKVKARYLNWLYHHSDFYRFVYYRLSLIKYGIKDFYSSDSPLLLLEKTEEQLEQWEVSLKDIVDTCRTLNITCVYVIFPMRDQIGRLSTSELFLDNFAKKYNVPYLDLINILKEEHFCDRFHLTKAGHQITADAIYRFLKDEQILDY